MFNHPTEIKVQLQYNALIRRQELNNRVKTVIELIVIGNFCAKPVIESNQFWLQKNSTNCALLASCKE